MAYLNPHFHEWEKDPDKSIRGFNITREDDRQRLFEELSPPKGKEPTGLRPQLWVEPLPGVRPFIVPVLLNVMLTIFTIKRVNIIEVIINPTKNIPEKVGGNKLIEDLGVERGGYNYFFDNIEAIMRSLLRGKFKPARRTKYAEFAAMLVHYGVLPRKDGTYQPPRWYTETLFFPPPGMINLVNYGSSVTITGDVPHIVEAVTLAASPARNEREAEVITAQMLLKLCHYYREYAVKHLHGGDNFKTGILRSGAQWRVPFTGYATATGMSDPRYFPDMVLVPWRLAVKMYEVELLTWYIDEFGLTPLSAKKRLEFICDQPQKEIQGYGVGQDVFLFLQELIDNGTAAPYKLPNHRHLPRGTKGQFIRYPSLTIKSIPLVRLALNPDPSVTAIAVGMFIAPGPNLDLDGDQVGISRIYKPFESPMRGLEVYRHQCNVATGELGGTSLPKDIVLAINVSTLSPEETEAING